MYTNSMFPKRYSKLVFLGGVVAALFFFLLVVAGYDQTPVDTAIGLIVFLLYTETKGYHEEHGKDAKSTFYSFLAFLVGLSVTYLILWILLLIALAIFPGPTLSV